MKEHKELLLDNEAAKFKESSHQNVIFNFNIDILKRTELISDG